VKERTREGGELGTGGGTRKAEGAVKGKGTRTEAGFTGRGRMKRKKDVQSRIRGKWEGGGGTF